MSGPLPLRFVTSATDHRRIGPSIREIAVAGRSNVGKSSLINALANRKSLARTSKTPGATQQLNIYELEPEGSGRLIVDLPGYGYANAPAHAQERWARLIERYLIERAELEFVLLLVDGAVGPTALDRQSLEWFDHVGVPIRLVATKLDKVKRSKLGGRKRDLAEGCGVAADQVRWVSAATGAGIPELRREIHAELTDP